MTPDLKEHCIIQSYYPDGAFSGFTEELLFDFNIVNAFKYLLRVNQKDSVESNIRKAYYYIAEAVNYLDKIKQNEE